MFEESYEPDDGPEWDDEYDNNTIECPSCGGEIYDDTPRCPLCGEYITDLPRSPGKNPTRWPYYVIVLIIVLTVLSFALPYLQSLFRLAD